MDYYNTSENEQITSHEKARRFKYAIGRDSKLRNQLFFGLFTLLLAGFVVGLAQLTNSDSNKVSPGKTLANSEVKLSPGLENMVAPAGTVGSKTPVIVRLNYAKTPERKLNQTEITTQHSDLRTLQDELLARLPKGSYEVVARYDFSPLLDLKVTAPALVVLRQLPDKVLSVSENKSVEPNLREARVVVGANIYEPVQNGGYNGTPYTVAVVDTGVDNTHPFLSGQVVGEACFGNNCLRGGFGPGTAQPDCENVSMQAGRNCGHGSAVAGIVAGKLNADGYQGIASGVKLVAVKAVDKTCDDTKPAGEQCTFSFPYSNLAFSLDWISDNLTTYNIASVNASVGAPYETGNCDAALTLYNLDLQKAIDALYEVNVPVVFSGGNEWDATKDKMSYPGCYSKAIMVAAAEKDKTVWPKTNLGTKYTNVIMAVGSKVSTASVQTNPGGLTEGSGSSLAAPEVASAFAILKQAAPTASIASLFQVLKDTGDTVSDTRDPALTGTYKMIRIDKALAYLLGAGPTITCSYVGDPNTDSTSSSCRNTFSGVLGDATSSVKGEVLQATSEYVNMALVTVSYSPSAINKDSVSRTATYCDDPMTLVSSTPAAGGGIKTDMFYLLNPKSGTCDTRVTHSKPAGERIISTTIYNNVRSAAPLASVTTTGSISTTYTQNPFVVNVDATGPQNSLTLCGYGQYSEQSTPPTGNIVTVNAPSRQLWKYERYQHIDSTGATTIIANLWGGVVGGVQRTAVGDSVQRVSWTFRKTMPWSAMCATFNVKPFVQPPAPLPFVDLRVNGLNGPISVVSGTAATLSWSSANVTSCTSSGSWTGTRPTGGTLTTGALTTSKTYTIVCTGPNNAQASDSVTVNVTAPEPTLSFVINDGGTIITDFGGIGVIGAKDVNFIWAYTGTASSCTALTTSAGYYLDPLPKWSGTKAKTGNQVVSIAFGGPYTFKLTCGTLSHTIQIGTATPSGPTPPPTPMPIPSPKPGLSGEYYDNENFTNMLFGRTDQTINYNWDVGTPDSRIGVDTFSTRWTGTLKVPTTGSYIFYSTVDDGVRIWIDNKLVLDKWGYSSHNGVETSTAAQALTQGDHNIKIEYHEGSAKARISLLWSGPGITKQVVPSTALLNMIPLSATMGLFGNYYDNEDFTGTRVMRMDANINFDWGGGSPDTKLAVDTFSAKWTGSLIVPTAGAYTFYGLLDDGMRVYVDEQLVFDKWGYGSHNGIEVAGTPVTLAAGNHSFRAEFHDGSGNARAMLSWSGPGITKQIIPPSSFINSYTAPLAVTGEYFNTENFTGTSITRVDPSINFNWSTNSPLAGINVDHFSVRWTGYIHTPAAGAYTFYTEVDDGIRVWVDGALVMDKWSWSSHSGAEQTSAAITLSAGTHALQVEQHEGGGGAKAIVRWKGPNISKQVLPIYLN